MRNTRGRAAVGDDFFGRGEELESLLDTLRRDNVLLLAPRRVGKTSLMHATAARWRAAGDSALFVDVQGASSELQFVRKLAQVVDKSGGDGLVKAAWRRMGQALRAVEKLGGSAGPVGLELALRSAAEDDWLAAADALLRALGDQGTEVLLLIDELPLVVQQILLSDPTRGRDRAKAFLDALRGWRMEPSLSRLHWLVAGSIGLDSLARRHGFSASINDFVLTPLGAFDDRTARRLVDALAVGHDTRFDDDARDHLVRRLGGWSLPYYVQILFGEARALARGGRWTSRWSTGPGPRCSTQTTGRTSITGGRASARASQHRTPSARTPCCARWRPPRRACRARRPVCGPWVPRWARRTAIGGPSWSIR